MISWYLAKAKMPPYLMRRRSGERLRTLYYFIVHRPEMLTCGVLQLFGTPTSTFGVAILL